MNKLPVYGNKKVLNIITFKLECRSEKTIVDSLIKAVVDAQKQDLLNKTKLEQNFRRVSMLMFFYQRKSVKCHQRVAWNV